MMPTGYGKSLSFKVLFSTAVKLRRLSEWMQYMYLACVVLVICPLAGLMQDQVEEGNLHGLNCSGLQDMKDLLNSLSQIIFTSLEQVLGTSSGS